MHALTKLLGHRQECPQPKDWYFNQEPRIGIVYDEFNCLNLDIVSPPPSKDGSLYPCMVWVHGGAFRNKTGGSDAYDATKFVRQSIEIGRPVVVVNVTHRLNMFGFFSSSDIQKEVQDDGEKVFGSWGIDDIAIAVQWVTCNAEPPFCALLCPMLIHPHFRLDKATCKRFWR